MIAWLLVLLFTCDAFAENSSSPVGRPAPEFKAFHLNGSVFHSTELRGEIVLLDFWAVWCPPCIEAIPKLNRLQKEFGSKNLKVLGIAVYSGTSGDVRRFMQEHKMEYMVVLGDEEALEAFGVIGYPTYFLVDPEGKVRHQYVGELQNLYDLVENDIKLIHSEIKKKEQTP